MTLADKLAEIGPTDSEMGFKDAEKWMQGRTMYGGMSALIAYLTATRAFPDLPPLRAGQIGFVAPVGDRFTLRAESVREGRSVTQIRSEILVDGNVALTAFWLFGGAREANAKVAPEKPDNWTGPAEDAEELDTSKAPSFLHENYQIRRAQDFSGPGEPVVRRWIKLKEPSGLDPVAEMVLLGDTLPPGAMRVMERQGPLSSINWSFNLLDTEPQTTDGWWLTENGSMFADEGYSSERLRLWNADGKQMLAGMQQVAIFG